MQANARLRLFGTNGVRGIYGQELTHDIVIDLCYALATYFGKGPIVVGYDGRKSSPVLSRLVRATLNSAGLDTANAGLLPTPCLQYAAKRFGYSGGIMVTASHNPPQYNGIKPDSGQPRRACRDCQVCKGQLWRSVRWRRRPEHLLRRRCRDLFGRQNWRALGQTPACRQAQRVRSRLPC